VTNSRDTTGRTRLGHPAAARPGAVAGTAVIAMVGGRREVLPPVPVRRLPGGEIVEQLCRVVQMPEQREREPDLDGVTRPHEVIPPRCYAAVGMPWRAKNATKSVPSSVQARTVRGRLAASRWRRQDGRSALSSPTLAARCSLAKMLDSKLYHRCARPQDRPGSTKPQVR
jgi:hypothetical protein